MRFSLTVFVLFAFLLTPLYPVYAEESSTTSSSTKPRTTVRDLVKERKEKLQTQRMEFKDEFKEKRAEIKDLREEFREKRASLSAQLRTRLAKFRDQKKAEIIERVSENLNAINDRLTNHMADRLERLTNILNKAKERLAKKTDSSGNISAQEAIDTAESAIATASAAVDTQALKDYTVKITTENGAKLATNNMRESLHKDLKATHEIVKMARKAVIDALVSVNKVRKEATSSGQQ